MKNKRILVAGSPEGQLQMRQALDGVYELCFVSTIEEAKRVLNREAPDWLDMIIACIHFDDCRMFELLEYIRSVDHFDSLPFLVIQAKPSISDDMASTKKIAEFLGASGFLELQNLPGPKANNALREAVEGSFDKAVKYLRVDKNGKKKSKKQKSPIEADQPDTGRSPR